jgi:ankyrin repeat protein
MYNRTEFTKYARSGKRRSRAFAVLAALALAVPAVTEVTTSPVFAQASPRADLFRAIQRDDAHGLRNALLRGADANRPDELGTPPIVAAAQSKAWKTLRALAELQGTDLEAADANGSTALMGAALHGELPIVQYLLSRKAEVNRQGWTALHYAAANGHADVVRLLLDEHAYIDAESPNRTTPLMMAVRQGHPTVVRLLIDEGADPTPRNDAGLTAAAYARATGDTKLADWLEQQAEAFRRKYPLPSRSRGQPIQPSSTA